jgi:hypothetical protein
MWVKLGLRRKQKKIEVAEFKVSRFVKGCINLDKIKIYEMN